MSHPPVPETAHGVVAAGDQQTVDAGVAALRAGGNAVDAAVASAFAAFVCEAPLCSPLGGGALVIAPPDGPPRAFDLFARTPGLGGAEPTMADFAGIEVDFGATTQIFHVGRASAAVPLALPGLFEVHRRWGKLPLPVVAAPGVQLGRGGYLLSKGVAFVFDLLWPIAELSPEARALYGGGTRPAKGGTRLYNAELADTLEALARDPRHLDALHRQLRAEFGPEHGGLITADDLRDVRPAEYAPIQLEHGDWTVNTMPGPSTGGILVALGTRLLADAIRAPFGSTGQALAALDVQRRLHELRGTGLDEKVRDPAFVANLLAAPTGQVHPEREHPLGSTTHISTVDADGCAVSVTLTNGEGCGYVLSGTGIQVNNLMGEEDIHPRGFHQDPPGHALTTMMAPTIARHRNGDLLVLGSGGSNRLRNAIMLTLSHIVDHGRTAREAVDAPRLHLESTDDGYHLAFERAGLSPETVAALLAAWPAAAAFDTPNMFFGGVHTATRLSGVFGGAGDRRRGGHCAVA